MLELCQLILCQKMIWFVHEFGIGKTRKRQEKTGKDRKRRKKKERRKRRKRRKKKEKEGKRRKIRGKRFGKLQTIKKKIQKDGGKRTRK